MKVGVVFDGSSRDLQEITNIKGFNAFDRDFHPSFTEEMVLNTPIRFGKAIVLPGDLVIATIEGGLFVPAHLAEQVVSTAEFVIRKDQFGFEITSYIQFQLKPITMKLLLTAVFIVGCLNTFAQNTIDGEWKGTRDTPNGAFEINYTFKVEGTELTGVWKTQFGEAPLQNGKVDGKNLSYSISFNDMTINSTGEVISDDEIQIKNERGEMKLTRVKQ